MTDPLTPERRSEMMGRIKGKNTRPELAVRRLAHSMGLRFRLHRSDLPGRPDLVFPRHRLAVFVHGCFWHRHEGCANCTSPKTRPEFWQSKFESNVARDQRVAEQLEALGWRVGIIWECEAKTSDLVAERLRRLTRAMEVT